MPPGTFRPGFRADPSRVPVPLVNIPFRRDQKSRFDDIQSFLSWRVGRRLAQWEVTDLFLSEDAADGALVAEALRATAPERGARMVLSTRVPALG